MFVLFAVLSKLDRQMFCLMWGPTIAAVSVVLDHASDSALVRKALDGLLTAAKIASFHHVDEVMDSLVVSLSKFTSILEPGAPKPALAFGENEKVRMATQTMFTLANRSGLCNMHVCFSIRMDLQSVRLACCAGCTLLELFALLG